MCGSAARPRVLHACRRRRPPADLIGRQVQIRADSRLVKIYVCGQLVKTHARVEAGGRVTDPADLPEGKAEYATRNIEAQREKAHQMGRSIGVFVDILLDNPLPWTRMRHVYALFRACQRFGDTRVDTACERAVDAGCCDVKIVIGMVERALEADTAKADPVPNNVIIGRFARDNSHFAVDREVTQ